MRVTKADEAKREVLEFNDKPAVVACAEAVGDRVIRNLRNEAKTGFRGPGFDF